MKAIKLEEHPLMTGYTHIVHFRREGGEKAFDCSYVTDTKTMQIIKENIFAIQDWCEDAGIPKWDFHIFQGMVVFSDSHAATLCYMRFA